MDSTENLVALAPIKRPADMPMIGSRAEAAKLFVVDDDVTREIVIGEIATLAGQYKQIEAARVSMKKPIDEAAKAVQAFFKPHLDDNEEAQRVLRGVVQTYDREVEQKRRLAQAEAEKAAREERERLEREAVAAAANGEVEVAQALAQTAEVIVAPTLPPAVAKVAGAHKARTWSTTINDRLELLRSIIEHPEYFDEILEVKQGGLNSIGRRTNGTAPLKGVTWSDEATLRVRAA